MVGLIFSDKYRHNPDIVSRSIAEEVVLVPIRNNMADMDFIYTLNDTAAFIWELCNGENSLHEIFDQLIAEFDVEEDLAVQDFRELIQHLLEIHALLKVD